MVITLINIINSTVKYIRLHFARAHEFIVFVTVIVVQKLIFRIYNDAVSVMNTFFFIVVQQITLFRLYLFFNL